MRVTRAVSCQNGTMSEHEQDPAEPENTPEPATPEGDAGSPAPAPQWIPVPQQNQPPQNPYAGDAPARPAGRGLAISAMALGLAALLTTVVAAMYLKVALVLGALLGLVAVILGVVAVIRRQQPRAGGFVGIAGGALSVLGALVVGALAVSMLLAPGGGTALGSGDDPGTKQTESPEGDASALAWPANMATGGIIFGKGLDPVRSEPLTTGDAPKVAEVGAAGSRADVLMYLDYRCPYCMQFEEQNGAFLEQAVNDGTVTLEIVPLTFLDRVSAGSQYSSRAAAAVQCVVDGQPAVAWKAHAALLSTEWQPAEGIEGPSDGQLVGELDRATGGLDPAVADCITSRRFVPFAQALNDWVFANPIPNTVQPGQSVDGTPKVLVNGVAYTGDPADGAAFQAFFAEQTR